MALRGKIAKKVGVTSKNFEGRAVENFFSTLNISKTGEAIYTKFSAIAGLNGPSLRFGPEVGGGSNFEGSGEQSCQKWHFGWRVGYFRRLSEFLHHRNFEYFCGLCYQGHVATRNVHLRNFLRADKKIGDF